MILTMLNQLADQFRNNHHQYPDTVNPFLTAAATYLGSELLQHHYDGTVNDDEHNDHRSHFWRNAAVSGLLAYVLNKYQDYHHRLPQTANYYPNSSLSSSSYYPSSPYYRSRPSYYPPSYYYPTASPSAYYMNSMTMNPYCQPHPYMRPHQQPFYGGDHHFILPHHHPHYYNSFPSSHYYHHHMTPYHRPLPYRYMY